MSLCVHCISGVTHKGTPVGKIEKIGGIDTYVTKPEGEFPKDKALLFLTDVFGIQLINSRLLVDDYARNGFQVYAPEYLNDDPVPPDALDTPGFDVLKWFKNHSPDRTRPPLDGVIKALKEQGVTSLAAVGFCFGGRYVFDLSFENVIKAAVVAHPTLLQIPADLEKLIGTSKAPLLINAAEVDEQFPLASQKQAEELLGGGKYKPGFEQIFWPGTVHGFAVRGDLSKPEVKAAKEGAFKASVEWLIKHL